MSGYVLTLCYTVRELGNCGMKLKICKMCLWVLAQSISISQLYGNSNDLKAAAEEPVQIISYGIYEIVPEEGFDGKVASKNVVSGYPRFIEQTEKVPAKLGTRFGFSFAVFGINEKEVVGLRRVIKHPPMTTKDGTVSTGREYVEEFEVLHGAVVGGTGYYLEDSRELVPGDWTFEYWLGNQKLLTKTFEVFLPSS